MSEVPVAVYAPCGCLYRWHADEGRWYCALTARESGPHSMDFCRALNADPGRSYSLAAAGMAMAKMGVGRA